METKNGFIPNSENIDTLVRYEKYIVNSVHRNKIRV